MIEFAFFMPRINLALSGWYHTHDSPLEVHQRTTAVPHDVVWCLGRVSNNAVHIPFAAMIERLYMICVAKEKLKFG